MTASTTDKSHLLRFGYAPGSYAHVKCNDCKKRYLGDPYSRRCEACAESLYSQVTSVEAVVDKHRTAPILPELAMKAAEAEFATYFMRNYPGPDTIIHKPEWHAPKLFYAAKRAILWALEPSSAGLPRDPTDEMVDAALAVDWENEDERATIINIWHAMTAKLATLQPSAARELALEEGDLNARLKAKGMYSIDEMMGSLPLDKWRVHSGMTDLKFFGEWLERKAREYLIMKAAYDVGRKDEGDDLYEWVLAHYGAFHDVLVNFRAALSSPDHADDLAVDRFAIAMKQKLAKKREEGRGGWENKDECSAEYLSYLLIQHIWKGDPVDIANLAMMLQQRGERVVIDSETSSIIPDHADAGKVEGDARADLERFWRPISEADRTITYEDTFNLGDGKSMTIRNSDHFWVRDADGRVYEATWSDHKGGYWWDLEGESRVDPVEYMPHPLSLPSAPASEGAE